MAGLLSRGGEYCVGSRDLRSSNDRVVTKGVYRRGSSVKIDNFPIFIGCLSIVG